MTENTQLELAPAELLIPLKVSLGNSTYRVRHRLRPPTAEDWFAYDAALAMAVEEVPLREAAEASSDGAGYKLELRSVEAAALLWDRLAQSLEGYTFKAEADWHELVPLAHKEAAVRALTLVAPADSHSPTPCAVSSPDEISALSPVAPLSRACPEPSRRAETRDATVDFPLQAEQIPVTLEAIVAGRAYPRLVHIFRLPTADDERHYRRLLADTLIVRGRRAARTLIPSRLPALCRLYDRLILSVEGYCLQQQPLASRDQLLQHMDAWHKRTAVQALFGEAAASDAASVIREEVVL